MDTTISDNASTDDIGDDIPTPRWISHAVFKSKHVEEMIEWYKTLFNAYVVNENPGQITFMTWDDEHHRVAFQHCRDFEDQSENTVGLSHLAFSYNTVADVMRVYGHAKAGGVVPEGACNHGNTTSLYYLDPDGNTIEIFTDNFDTGQECIDYKINVQFKPGFGTHADAVFEPEKMLALVKSGLPETTLRDREWVVKMHKEGKL